MKQICPSCESDLTMSGSVYRTYQAPGRYDEKGFFEKTGSLDGLEPDSCAVCSAEVYGSTE